MSENRKAPKKLIRGNTVPPKVMVNQKKTTTVQTNTEQAGRTAPPKVPVNKKKS
jgi:hypothetical protein